MELNFTQHLASVDQELLLLVFLYIIKANNNLYSGRILKTLEGYRVGPKMQGILAEFGTRKEMVTRKNGEHVPQFRKSRVTTQRGPTSPKLFKVTVYNMVRHWLSITVDDDVVIHNGTGYAVGWIMVFFYAYNFHICFHDLEWIQGFPNIIIGQFRHIGLMANLAKSKTMMCQLGKIQLGMSEEAVGLKSMSKGDKYLERLRIWMPCQGCGVELTKGSMTAYRRRLHRTDPVIYWDRLQFIQMEHLPQVFEVRFPRVTTKCQCPFPGCPGLS